jgi:hypothetical protein
MTQTSSAGTFGIQLRFFKAVVCTYIFGWVETLCNKCLSRGGQNWVNLLVHRKSLKQLPFETERSQTPEASPLMLNNF